MEFLQHCAETTNHWAKITYLYLIDEFENFDIPQQQYVNSLIREKRSGTSFMIGVRTYGLRTRSTIGGGEENKRGSEYDEIRPDRTYTGSDSKKFSDFCRNVVGRRLSEYDLMDEVEPGVLSDHLKQFFEVLPEDHEENRILGLYEPSERPYLNRLKNDLLSFGREPDGGSTRLPEVDFIVDATRVPCRPLLEKINVFLIYRTWSRGENLTEAACEMIEARPSLTLSGVLKPNEAQQSILNHFVTDMKAQLSNDSRGRQMYAGMDQFIIMADGLPRNLLVILKNIYRWALFNGEQPFSGHPISLESQRLGVVESAEWFFADAKPLGEDGEDVHKAINNLGDMFRRFSLF